MAKKSKKNLPSGANYDTADFDKTPLKDEDAELDGNKGAPHSFRNNPPHRLPPFIVGVIGVLLAFFLLSDLFGINIGVVGSLLDKFMFGVFGGSAWFIPLFLLSTAIFWRRDAENQRLIPNAIFATVCVIFISVLFYDFSSLSSDIDSGVESFGIKILWDRGVGGSGGGVIGGLVGQGLNLCIGAVGTVIVSILAIITSIIFYLSIDVPMLIKRIVASIGQARANEKERRRERCEADLMAAEQAEKEEKKHPAEEDANAPRRKRPGISNPTPTESDDFEDAIIDYGVADDEKPAPTEIPEVTYGPASGVKPNRKHPVGVFDFDSDADTAADFSDDETIPPSKPTREVIPPISFEDLDDIDEDNASEPSPASTVPSNRSQIIESLEDDYLEDEIIHAPKSFEDFEKITSTEADELIRAAEAASVSASTPPERRTIPEEVPTAEKSPTNETQNDAQEPARAVIRPDMIVDKSSVAKSAKEYEPVDMGDDTYAEEPSKPKKDEFKYKFPPYTLLKTSSGVASTDMNAEIQANADKLIETLASFNVRARISSIARGPRITRYELVPDAGIRIRSIANLVDDISMNLASAGIRIEAPIPGKAAVGIEVPNKKASTVNLRDLLDTDVYRSIPSKTCVCLGSDVAGDPVFCDIAKMPHMLIAGATGMGKSVCINVIITSILYKADPNEVKLILIDPKKVELGIYGGIPHLLVPVVNDPQKAAGALSWAVGEMERRFDIFEDIGVRDIKGYNKQNVDGSREKLPSIIIIIDELHDLMMVSPDSVEKSIVRIAQKARAAGIHLILGTQRPSVDVITGVIKANVPSRIAFHVASQVDSRTILDMVGAEKLLNNGDMLYMAVSESKAKRVQGAFVDEDEVAAVTDFIKNQTDSNVYDEEVMKDIEREAEKCDSGNKKGSGDASAAEGNEDLINDPKFRSAIELSIEFQKISTSLLQRKLGIGYGKAAKFIDQMHEMGIVSGPDGQKPRNVLITHDQYLEMIARNGD